MRKNLWQNEKESAIANINSICLFEIFKQIKSLCERERPNCEVDFVKYADLTRFVATFKWTRIQFYYWDKELYKNLGIEAYNTEQLTIDFGEIYGGLQGHTQKERDEFFKLLINRISNEIRNLYLVYLTNTSDTYYDNHLDFFQMIMNALQKKSSLQHLSINMKGYTMENLSDFRNLAVLRLNGRIYADELVECCKSNPNLEILLIRTDEIYGRLSDITLAGSSLQYLRILEFRMKPGIDAVEYAPLAKLPKLNGLIIRGEHEIGSLKHLFGRLAARKRISILDLKDANMNDEEIQFISRIETLEKLTCGFSEPESIRHLSQLSKLKDVDIKSEHEVGKMLTEVWKFLKSHQSTITNIHFRNVTIIYDKCKEELRWAPGLEGDELAEYESYSEVPYVRFLCIVKNQLRTGSQHNLFRGLALQVPQTLQHLQLLHYPDPFMDYRSEDGNLIGLTSNEILEIAAIGSLKSINFIFADLSNIDILGQLPQLEELTINVLTTIKEHSEEALKKLFKAIASSSSPALKFLDVSPKLLIGLTSTSELVQIQSLRTLKCSFSDDESIKCLDKLTELKDLKIESQHHFSEILGILSSSNTSIQMKKDSLKNSITFHSRSNELELQLKQGTDASHYAPLGNLEKCNSFVVTGECKLGSLHSLIQTLSANKNLNLKVLHLKDTPISYEETLLVSQIRTLKRLTCQFSDARSFEVELPEINFKEIQINENKLPHQAFNFIKYSDGETIIQNKSRSIKYEKKQGKLILKNGSTDDYAFLEKLDNLQILHITTEHISGSLRELFSGLSLNSTLKELIIDMNINSNEVMEIARIASLKKLKCGFSGSKNLETLAQLKKLEKLSITGHQIGSLQRLFERISSQSSSSLKYLSIENSEITFDELRAIACIRSLVELNCDFTIAGHENVLAKLPHLTNLTLRSHLEGSIFNKLRLFVKSALTSISILGKSLDVKDFVALSKQESLKRLKLKLGQVNTVDAMSPLKELEVLQIEFVWNTKSIDVPINLLKITPNLCKLAIKKFKINNRDFSNILQLPFLKSLECYLEINESTNLTRLQQLEELIIISEQRTRRILLQALIKESPTNLKHFVINGDRLDMEGISQLSQISSLTALECYFQCAQSIHFLAKLLNLKKLIISGLFADFTDILNILRACRQLELMHLNFSIEFKGNSLYELLDILKIVRDPIAQEPLKLVLPGFRSINSFYLTPDDERYLTISPDRR